MSSAALTAALLASLIPGLAQVISDPTGNDLFSVGTAGENTSAKIAVSNGGMASSNAPIACTPTDLCVAAAVSTGSSSSPYGGISIGVNGCAEDGLVILSLTCASGPGALVIAPEGSADGGGVAVSGTGPSRGSVAVSLTGDSNAKLLAISGTGNAYACGGDVNGWADAGELVAVATLGTVPSSGTGSGCRGNVWPVPVSAGGAGVG